MLRRTGLSLATVRGIRWGKILTIWHPGATVLWNDYALIAKGPEQIEMN